MTAIAHKIPPESASPLELWPPWDIVEVVDDIVIADELRLQRVGVTAETPDGLMATGAAAERDGSALGRARGELVERACLLEALAARLEYTLRDRSTRIVGYAAHETVFPSSPEPEIWQRARSNGVAFAPSWLEACTRARAELAERDRVLRSWYGMGPPPRRVPLPAAAGTPSYRWEAYQLPAGATWSAELDVAIVVAVPTHAHAPLLRGFGAGSSVFEAVSRALAEAQQGLAFTWDEPLPGTSPVLEANPVGHLDFYLWPGNHRWLRAWLDGRTPARAPSVGDRDDVRYVDLTAPGMAAEGAVVKAICDAAYPLVFGRAPSAVSGGPRDEHPPHPIA